MHEVEQALRSHPGGTTPTYVRPTTAGGYGWTKTTMPTAGRCASAACKWRALSTRSCAYFLAWWVVAFCLLSMPPRRMCEIVFCRCCRAHMCGASRCGAATHERCCVQSLSHPLATFRSGLPCRHMLAASGGHVTKNDVPLRYVPDFVAGNHDQFLPRVRDDVHQGLAIAGKRTSTVDQAWSAALCRPPASLDVVSGPLANAGPVASDAAAPAARARAKRAAPGFLEAAREGALETAAAALCAAGRSHATETGYAERLVDQGLVLATAAFHAVLRGHITTAAAGTGPADYERVTALANVISSKVFSGHGDGLALQWVAAASAADTNFNPPSKLTYVTMKPALAGSVFAAVPDGIAALESAYPEFNDTKIPREFPGDRKQRRQFHSQRAGRGS